MSEFMPVELEHAGTVLTGKAAIPAGAGPFPAVLVMHNALGIGDRIHEVLQRLAALGYVADWGGRLVYPLPTLRVVSWQPEVVGSQAR
mgnify:CR=1 FL=1